MKKNLFMVAAVALLATVSCNKEIIEDYPAQNAPASDVEFTAGISTRTALGTTADPDGVKPVTWVKNDKITVNGVEFYTEEEGEVVRFKTANAFDEAETYYAAYPSGAASGEDLSAVTISASQTGIFAAASISVAVSNDKTLSFKNVGSMLKFQVPAAASEVTIESTSNLAGTFPVTFDEAGEPVIGTVTDGSKTITLEGSFEKGTDYYVAVLPGSHKFTISIDGFVSKASTKEVKLVRAQLGGLETLPPLDLVYLAPNDNWKTAKARFAVYNYKDNTTYEWVDLKAYNGVYACEKSQLEYSNMIFCRMDPSKTENVWENKWNQTADMTIESGKPYCVIPFDVWDGCKVWSATSTYDKSGYLYLLPNSDWISDNAWFAAYFFNIGEKWVKMEQFSSNPVYYRVQKQSDYPSVIFCRMNPSNTTLGWGAKWNQTSDLTIGTNYFYQVTGWNNSGKWITKE